VHSAPTALPRHNLDVLRAVAVLLVVGTHISIIVYDPLAPKWTQALGHVGVLLFFVHTSLVLMSSIERLQRESRPWVGRFYARRAFRIYPLAMAVIVACVAFSLPPNVHDAALANPDLYRTPIAIGANLLLVQNLMYQEHVLIVLWSLPIEVQMYVLLPAAYLLTRHVRRVVFWLIVAVVFGVAVVYSPLPGSGRLGLVAYAPCFMAGVLAFARLRRGHGTASGWFTALLIVAVLGVAGLTPFMPRTGMADWGFCLAVGLLVPHFRDLPANVGTRISHIVAKYSYGVYLLHIPALYFTVLWHREWPAGVRWSLFPVVLAVLSWVAFHMIEEPAIRLGQRLTVARPRMRMDARTHTSLASEPAAP
jgi:peptidoglycan/LPS O-acetylase OafA/YrhL